MNLAQAILDKGLIGSGMGEVAELFNAFLGKEFKLSSAIGAFTAIVSSPLVSEFLELSLTGFAKEKFAKLFGKKALMQWNAVGKAVSTGWAVGTKFFPAYADSCTAPEQLKLNVVDGQISNVEPLKVHIKIEDITANTTVLDFNEIDNTAIALPSAIDLVDGHTYRYTLRGYQKGALDRSENGSDAAHQSLDANVLKTAAGRPSQQIWSAKAYRTGLLSGSRANIHFLNQITCVYKRPLDANYHFANVKFTNTQGQRYGVNCNSDDAYVNGSLYDAGTDTYFGSGIELQERTYASYRGPKSYDWSELVANHADKGFGGPFKIISNDIVHSSAQDIKSLNFAFSEFGNLAKDRLLTILVNTQIYRVDSIDCGVPVLGQAMTCVVKGAGFPLASSNAFAFSSSACSAVSDGTLAVDPSLERRFVCTPNMFGNQTVALSWNKLSQLVTKSISIAATNISLPALSAATDTGQLASDGITNNRTPVIMGTAPANSIVEIYDGNTKIGSVAAFANGSWQYVVNSALLEGAHTITARTTQGGLTVSSPAAAIKVDTVAPSAPVIAQALRQSTSTIASGTAEPNTTLSIIWPDNSAGSTTANAVSGAWTVTTTNVYAVGAMLAARATDQAGNVSVNATKTLVVPTIVYPTPPAHIRYAEVDGYPFTSCVKDKSTNLTWEIKTADGGLRDWRNVYTNFDDPNKMQDDFRLPTAQMIAADTNSIGYANAVNASRLCGFSDWRVPSITELQSLLDTNFSPPIDQSWFPNTKFLSYYNSSTECTFPGQVVQQRYIQSCQYAVAFGEGRTDANARFAPFTNAIRLVRSSP
jgi:Protein of unknown function (DUF1566)/Bacterial Ig-like domain/Bacterial Ig domain